ncbi:type 1 phosphatidylinositol 4,5-bisphosphate 4-phosphatase-like protein [Plakobranchus ocellatus]|uniref:Phosphatidylinositol-4,5-bisphosphate 4-phosphatase n=1 Tax=Plakobranchus ocellatus TaxID=259542 RepID=A0AAV4DGI3_9GAST|nr:type 1 phosphatidylinositol 4,5-bisphosphate 4-phosphatase-like protein [Plakobranchus ocellatus]
MATTVNEGTPLLAEDNTASASQPPPYSQTFSDANNDGDAATLPIGTDELPPPYTPTAQGGIPMINCKVCQAIISLEGKQHLFVVKCSVCGEATPIRAAPPGKKYIRCPCNLLLVCRSGATKILCPKDTCKRVITLPSTSANVASLSRFTCGYCAQLFVLHSTMKFAKCPHCRRWSSVIVNHARVRGHIYLLLGIIILLAAIGITIGTLEVASRTGGIYVAWTGGFVLGIILIIRAIILYSIRAKIIEEVDKKVKSKAQICRDYEISSGHYTFLKDKGAIMSALTKGNFQPDRKRLKTTGPRN